MKANSKPHTSEGDTPDHEAIALPTPDGAKIHIEHFPAAASSHPPLMITPAMGAPARAYREIARTLSKRGFPVILFDHRGSGPKAPSPSHRVDFGVGEYLTKDWPTAMEWIGATYPHRKPVLIGHSLGGQLNSIYAGQNPDNVAGLVNLCAVWIHFRQLGVLRLQLGGLTFYLALRVLANVLGYAPGDKLGWGARFSKQHTRDWSSWGIFGRYTYQGGDGRAALRNAPHNTLAISFSDDTRLGPKPACDRFCLEMTSARLYRWHLTPDELGQKKIGHFGALKANEELWMRVADWIDETIS